MRERERERESCLITHTHTEQHAPEGGSGGQRTRVIDDAVVISDGAASQSQSEAHILLVSRMDGAKGRGGVSQIHGNSHEHIGQSRVRYEAIVCSLGPANDRKPWGECGAVVRAIGSQLQGEREREREREREERESTCQWCRIGIKCGGYTWTKPKGKREEVCSLAAFHLLLQSSIIAGNVQL